ncbi:MAG: amidase family protein, partial [Gammaproteobacteria bacterium]
YPLLRSFRFGIVPEAQLPGFANPEVGPLMHRMQERLMGLGGRPVEIDYSPFQQAAELLYEGPWVAERYAAIEKFIQSDPEALHPVTRSVISKGADFNAVDTYRAMYRLQELKRLAEREMAGVDFILTPTAADIYTIRQLEADPVRLNTQLGYYTNFMNLLDYAAIAIPAGYFSNGLPFGVTLFADKFSDSYLIELAHRILTSNHHGTESSTPSSNSDNSTGTGKHMSPGTDRLKLLVCGAHLKGMALNHQLTDLGAFLLESTTTAPVYRLYCLAGGPPYRPGLIKDMENGTRIAVEVWSIPARNLGEFLSDIPAPLGLGKVELNDGTEVTGFICEAYAITRAEDISNYGGWKNYINSI